MAKRNEGAPYMVEVVTASMMGKDREATMLKAVNAVGKELQDLINSYHPADIPLVCAIMQVTADAVLESTGPTGKAVCEDVKRGLVTIAVHKKVEDKTGGVGT